MKPEEKIACMCLCGFILKEPVEEKIRCIASIETIYGKKMSEAVRGYLGL